jgi:hypothetical protein
VTKTSFGIIFGAALGILDGLTSWFSPEARLYVAAIIMGSTFKGAIIGAICGLFARKKASTLGGVVLGLLVGLTVSIIIASIPTEYPLHHYIAIVGPDSVLGLLLGYATQKLREKYNADGTLK